MYSHYYILAISSKCMFLWLIDFPKLRQNLQLSGSLSSGTQFGFRRQTLLILVLVNLKVRARSGDPGSSFSQATGGTFHDGLSTSPPPLAAYHFIKICLLFLCFIHCCLWSLCSQFLSSLSLTSINCSRLLTLP